MSTFFQPFTTLPPEEPQNVTRFQCITRKIQLFNDFRTNVSFAEEGKITRNGSRPRVPFLGSRPN